MTWTRRQVLGFLLASAVASSALANVRRPRIGLALGSGGARGLAHLLVFELLDELGLRPHRISGSSIGAVMGSLYAAGISGAEIRELLDRMTVSSDESWLDSLLREDLMRWLSFLQPSLEPGGIVKSNRLLGEGGGGLRIGRSLAGGAGEHGHAGSVQAGEA
jgi:NTE family protein